MRRIPRILHATDFSRASGPVFSKALDVAKQDQAQLLLLHVLVPPSPFVGNKVPSSYLELQARARRDAERKLGASLAKAKNAGVRAESKLIAGAPSEQILRHAARWHADLIVIGTHGRTGLGRAFMGSVAERILQRATCPVLTVRGR